MNSKSLTVIMLLTVLASFVMPASAFDIRGTVVTVPPATGKLDFEWTADNFAAFYYDIDENITSESLLISVTGGNIIEKNNLSYITSAQSVVKLNRPTYWVVGWQGEKWVGIGGKTNKIAKLALDMSDTDKFSFGTGEKLSLGAGYELIVNAVDAKASPRQAWITLLKNGVEIDNDVVGNENGSDIYQYKTTILGDSDILVFQIKITSIFSGTSKDMIQLKYGWLIDESTAKEIKMSDTYGSMKVQKADASEIILRNSETTITLSKNSDVTIMGNMKFKVANNGTIVRFYPFVAVSGDTSGFITTNNTVITPSTTSSQGTVVTTVAPTPVPTPVETAAPAPVVTVAPAPVAPPAPIATTPAPVTTTPAESTPGFEAVFAIVGLLLLSVLILRNKNKNE